MDDADRASEREQEMIELALERARHALGNCSEPVLVRTCLACADLIAAERLAVLPGARYCIHCQFIRERRAS